MPIDPKLACAAVLLVRSATALAENNPWYIAASQAYAYESNLLRLGTNQATPDGYSRNDDVLSTSLLGGLDQQIGRQHLYGNVAVRQNRYRSNAQFNNTGYTGNLVLDWSTIERISGTLSANANRALQSFNSDGFSAVRLNNQESTEAINGNIAVGLVTQYSLLAGLGRRHVHNSLNDASIRAREYYQDNADLSLRWVPNAIYAFGLGATVTKGRYPKFTIGGNGDYVADRFTRNDIVLTASAKPTGASSIDARIADGRTRYAINNQRDFSGVTGSIAWAWQASGKLRLNTQYSRDTGQESYPQFVFSIPTTADFSRVVEQLRVQAAYDVSAKVALNVSASYIHRDLVRTFRLNTNLLDGAGSDRTTMLSVGSRWSPRRFALLGCDVSMERRKASGGLTVDMQAKSLSCYGQLSIQ